MDFLLYEPEDFASDESYLRYYFRLNDRDVAFWQGWISNHPEKLDCVINADQLINLLSLQLDESELSLEYQRLSSAMENNAPDEKPTITDHSLPYENFSHNPFTFPVPIAEISMKKIRLVQRILTGAAFALITAGICFYTFPLKKNTSLANVANGSINFLKKVNNGRKALKYQLEDGSIITLQPGSVLNYPRNFLPFKREVFLEGEAFFEVSKNKKRPFYVYCQNLVAHVLGTSFNIKTDDIHGKIEVAVSTGKVEIYEKYKDEAADENKNNNGLILTPNQKAVYLKEDNKFESSLVDVPLPISHVEQDAKKDTLHLEAVYAKPTPMSEILILLGKEYGIDIEVENENLNNCHFSGPLTDMNLYLKLDAICQMVNATYEVKGTKILIRGRGCN